MKFGVIITTYNSPKWLERVLWGYENQSDDDFTIIIADDGSTSETKELITTFQARNKLNIIHIWHEDIGFRKTVILNKAIQETDCDYLMFTDGDCIPRADTIEVHKKHAKKGFYISAAYFKLNMKTSQVITESDIKSGEVFNYKWLLEHGLPKTYKSLKLTAKGRWATLLNAITPTKPTWNGANSSAFKEDIVAVNGFDERLQYGGLDRELGERMNNNGVKGLQLRYSTICLHLDHKRGYESPEIWQKNKGIRDKVKQQNLVWTDHGIKKTPLV